MYCTAPVGEGGTPKLLGKLLVGHQLLLLLQLLLLHHPKLLVEKVLLLELELIMLRLHQNWWNGESDVA